MGDWCALCECVGPDPAQPQEPTFDCPLLGKKICETCCGAELMGGMGAPDTLDQVCQTTQKTPREVHAICKACPHGGPEVGELGELVYSNPEKKKENEEFQEQWEKRLKWLRGDGPEEATT